MFFDDGLIYLTVMPIYIGAESIEWFIEGQSFSQLYDLAPRTPLPMQPLSPVPATNRRLRKRDYSLTGKGEGGGRGADHNVRPQESLALLKSFNPLCVL